MNSYLFLPKQRISLIDPFCGLSKEEKYFFPFAKGDHIVYVCTLLFI